MREIELVEYDIQRVQERIARLKQNVEDTKLAFKVHSFDQADRIILGAEASLEREYPYEEQLKDLKRIHELLGRRENYWSRLRANIENRAIVTDTK